jgi:serine/threonine-protein kinase
LGRKTHRWLAIAAAASVASGAWAEAWRTYVNPRYGVSADVPADWTMGPPPVDNDGRGFTSPDGSAEISVSGILSVLPHDQDLALRTDPGSGETITYKVVQGNLVVVSGFRGDTIFYRKSILDCRVWSDLSIEYPAGDKLRYDPLVVRVAASLKPGHGYDNPNCP